MFLISLWFFSPDFSAPLTDPVREEESGCPGFHVHIRTPPSLCCWLHTQERGDTARLQGPRMMRKLSDKNTDLQSVGNLECKDILEVTTLCLKHWSATVLDCCSRAPKDSSILVATLHLRTFTYTISLWTLCKWIRLDFLTQFIQGSKLSYFCRSLFKRQFLMHFPVFTVHVSFHCSSVDDSPKSHHQLLSIGRMFCFQSGNLIRIDRSAMT